jgi:hypothetical protein
MGTRNAIRYHNVDTGRIGHWTSTCELLKWIKAMLRWHAKLHIGRKAVIPVSDAVLFHIPFVQGVLLCARVIV